eukprot:snap_masked-scaffold_5-processed-gene-0.23-mRNA-1 protein AED:1.00 eAED:1.00 QI:0/-1/0/0/-1/1/1/0/200
MKHHIKSRTLQDSSTSFLKELRLDKEENSRCCQYVETHGALKWIFVALFFFLLGMSLPWFYTFLVTSRAAEADDKFVGEEEKANISEITLQAAEISILDDVLTFEDLILSCFPQNAFEFVVMDLQNVTKLKFSNVFIDTIEQDALSIDLGFELLELHIEDSVIRNFENQSIHIRTLNITRSRIHYFPSPFEADQISISNI